MPPRLAKDGGKAKKNAAKVPVSNLTFQWMMSIRLGLVLNRLKAQPYRTPTRDLVPPHWITISRRILNVTRVPIRQLLGMPALTSWKIMIAYPLAIGTLAL